MKRLKFLLALVILLSQTVDAAPLKTGWRISGLPFVGYMYDSGFQLGAVATACDYGWLPSLYPDYYSRITAEFSYFTKGQMLASAGFESSYLVPGVELKAFAAYRNTPYRSFYGFNGFEDYHSAWDRNADRSLAWYSMKNSSLTATVTMQGKIYAGLDWLAGLSFRNFTIGNISGDAYSDNTLYGEYLTKGIIAQDEAHGGNLLEVTAGLEYSSTDGKLSPQRGIVADLFGVGGMETGRSSYLKLCAHFKHYITPCKCLTLAYHLAYQGTAAGSAPFYIQDHIYSTRADNDFDSGLGGYTTLRGMLVRRLVGDGYAWANAEMRFRLRTWEVKDGTLQLGVNPFFDAGTVVQPFRLSEFSSAGYGQSGQLMDRTRRLHCSAGLGVSLQASDISMISLSAARSLTDADIRFDWCLSAGFVF